MRAGNQNGGGGIETGGLLSRKGTISSKRKITVSYMHELTDTESEKYSTNACTTTRTCVRRAKRERGGPSGRLVLGLVG